MFGAPEFAAMMLDLERISHASVDALFAVGCLQYELTMNQLHILLELNKGQAYTVGELSHAASVSFLNSMKMPSPFTFAAGNQRSCLPLLKATTFGCSSASGSGASTLVNPRRTRTSLSLVTRMIRLKYFCKYPGKASSSALKCFLFDSYAGSLW